MSLLQKIYQPVFVLGSIIFFLLFFAFGLIAKDANRNIAGQSLCGDIQIVISPSLGTYDNEIEAYINIANNQCVLSSIGFDLLFDSNYFSYLGVETQGCLTSDWSMMDGYEVNSGQIRIGGYAGSGSEISSSEAGSLLKIKLKVVRQCTGGTDGLQSTITIDSYIDDLEAYLPEPANAAFTMICCSGDISLPTNLEGTWGDLVHFPINIANNINQLCDFEFDFRFDPAVLEFKGIEKTVAIQNWSTLIWNQIGPGVVRISGIAGSGDCFASQNEGTLLNLKMMVACAGYEIDTPSPICIEEYGEGIVGLCPRTYNAEFLYKARPRLGDVNGDTHITPADAQAAFEIYLGRITPSKEQITTADANCGCPCDGLAHDVENNCITPMDAQWIFEHYLGRSFLPLCCAEYLCPESSVSSILSEYVLQYEKLRLYPLSSIGIPGERLNVPVIINNPQGIQTFSFEMNYPHMLLEFRGLQSSPLMDIFKDVYAEEICPGVIRIVGYGEERIKTEVEGSLCVAAFYVKEGMNGKGQLELYNLEGDIREAETGGGNFIVREKSLDKQEYISLGNNRYRDGILAVPVEVTSAFGLKAIGFDLKYSMEKLVFLGIERTYLTKDFVALDGNEGMLDTLRIGGFGMYGIQVENCGVLLTLMFKVEQAGGEVEIVEIHDDLDHFVILK